ncbi:uncharacterized protein FA14DRAFT_179677 [Meira miltonrushii]|uniref:Uncharacterized protein n=1 Tax=Meira miltonrushii TaxID=1280837 RepID=A0A316VFB2_9BASI|nr:uncharacterized protein FA14DRAFT_179677 [Meira miltonrushii]PWN36319.1 hypothetical protein FA14DRAFT_179677 [Meira miltonrushii]
MTGRQEREGEVKLPERQGRRVAFYGKCQVIPPAYFSPEDPVDNYFARKEEHLIGKKTSRIHFPFRSHKSGRRWSNASPDPGRSKSSNTAHESGKPSSAHHSRSHSVPIRAPSLSPTLHISRDGTANRLRQKLISPPPPSPLGRAVEEENDSEADASSRTPSTSPDANPLPLARPVAVRKPLTFGFDKDDEPERQPGIDQLTQRLSLRIPPIIYVHSISNKAVAPDNPAAAVLNWEETEEKGSSNSSCEEEEKDDGSTETEVFEEEDLHGECNCPDCESKMLAALAPNYTPNWTRSARRKYLADRKEAMHEQSRKSFKPPIWLKTEESELADNSSKLRDIQADEVDAKHGESQKEIVDKKADIDDHAVMSSITPEESTDDTIMQREVDQEVRLREEENRAKRTRNEMKRLSSDVGSGLRLGGGGARAMMRQLEEAEQAERRAKIERTRSPKSPDEVPVSNNVKLEIPSPGIESPTVSPNNLTVQVDKSSRTPSPLKRMFSNGTGPVRKPSPSDPAPMRHPSPSLLIKRELALGIPVQSLSSNNSSRSRQTWSGTPPISEDKKSATAKQEEAPQRAKLVRAETAINGSRRPSYDERRISNDQRPSSNLRRANTTGSGSRAQLKNVPPITIPAPISGHPPPSHAPNSPNNVVDKARAKARSSFKDFVARIKN